MKTLRILLLTSFFLAACAPVAIDTNSSSSSPSGMEDADDTGGNGETGTVSSAAASSQAGTARVIEITAADWAFTPSSITVKKGENITLKLTGASGVHGLGIPGLGISQRIDLGADVFVALPTDKSGSYSFFCNIPCGSGHKEMKGTIVIEE